SGEIEEVEANQRARGDELARPVLDLNEAAEAAEAWRRTDADVVAGDAVLARELAALEVRPVLDALVPAVGQRECVLALDSLEPVAGSGERCDDDRERERARARVLFPAVLL